MIQDIAGFPIQRNSDLYAWLFVYSTPVLWVFAYLVVLELYRLILEDYPVTLPVSAAGAVTWCMGLALAISVLYALPDLKGAPGPSPILRIYFVAERSTVLGLLLFQRYLF